MADMPDRNTPFDASTRKVPCPTCRRAALYGPGNPWRPFCSDRCRSADLGAWASERFRVTAEALTDPSTDNGMPPGGH